MPLANKIKQLRKERGWSQQDLADKIGAAGAHQISRYENGQTVPGTDSVIKLAEAFDVSCDYLLIDAAPRRPLHTLPDSNGLLDRLGDLAALDDDERAAVSLVLDALLTRHKLKDLAGEIT